MRATEAAGLAAPVATSVERLVRADGPALEFLVRRPVGSPVGTPLLFLHGAFAGAWCWDESWLGIVGETGRYAAAVSLRGHGGSDGREAVCRTGLTDFGADLALAIRAMPAPPVVIAHSVGGLLAQHMLGRGPIAPAAIRGLVLVSSLPPEGLALIGPWLGWSSWGHAVADLCADLCADLLGQARTSGDAGTLFGDGLRRGGKGPSWPESGPYWALAQAHVPQLVVPARAVGVPSLVLHGADDRLVDAQVGLRTALYHGAAYERMPSVGHFPMLGSGAAAGADALCRWLAAQGF